MRILQQTLPQVVTVYQHHISDPDGAVASKQRFDTLCAAFADIVQSRQVSLLVSRCFSYVPSVIEERQLRYLPEADVSDSKTMEELVAPKAHAARAIVQKFYETHVPALETLVTSDLIILDGVPEFPLAVTPLVLARLNGTRILSVNATGSDGSEIDILKDATFTRPLCDPFLKSLIIILLDLRSEVDK